MDRIDVWEGVTRGYLPKPPVDGWTFYYDETNNCRKFKLDPNKPEGFNSYEAVINDFILGGVAVQPNKYLDFDALKHELGMEHNKELKLAHFFRTDDFLYNMGSKQVSTLLRWILENNLMLHYFAINNVYEALIDLVDETLLTPGGKIVQEYHREIKGQVCEFVMEHVFDLAQIFGRFGYPNIDESDISDFCKTVSGYIRENENINDPDQFFLEVFRQNLSAMSAAESLLFLKGENVNELIGSYAPFYWWSMELTPNAHHVFDYESHIIRKFEELEFVGLDGPYKDFEFKHSTEEFLLQISDVMVGIVGKFFRFADSCLETGAQPECTDVQK